MKNKKIILWLGWLCVGTCLQAHAQEANTPNSHFSEQQGQSHACMSYAESRRNWSEAQLSILNSQLYTRATSYGLGFTSLQDTYLSPESYKGWEFRFSRETFHQTKRMQGKIWQQTYFQGNFGYTNNRADNNKTATALANWNYGWYYRQPLSRSFDVFMGGAVDLNGGFTYNMRNGNNPVSIRAHASVDASVMAFWNLQVKNRPLTLRYQASLPLLGLIFMPHYGQSYYEIFSIGERGGTVKVTTPFSKPSLRQLLSADYPVGKVTLRFTYVWDIQQAHVNEIKSHIYSHIFMIGVVKRFQKL